MRTITPGFLLAVLLVSPVFSEASSPTDQLLDQIADSKPANPHLKSAIDALKTQIARTRPQLPATLTNEFEQSIADRLRMIQVSVSQYIVPEYKTAMLGKRLLELSENVLTLPYRSIPQDPEQRKKAQQQYAAALERFEKEASDAVKHLDEHSSSAITGALRPVLTDVQNEIFRPGYGQRLNDEEKAELDRIANRVLKAAAALPAAGEKKRNAPSGFAAAGKVANEARQAVVKFLRNREAALGTNASYVTAMKKWRNEIKTIEQAIDRQTETGAHAEIKAITERARQQGLKDQLENDPKNIERQNNLKKVGPLL